MNAISLRLSSLVEVYHHHHHHLSLSLSPTHTAWKCGNVSGCMGASGQTAPAPASVKTKGVEGYPLIKEQVQPVTYGTDLEVGQVSEIFLPMQNATRLERITYSNLCQKMLKIYLISTRIRWPCHHHRPLTLSPPNKIPSLNPTSSAKPPRTMMMMNDE